MLKRKMRVLVSMAMSLAIVCLASGCSMLKKDPVVEKETEAETETQEMTESETEKQTEPKTDIAYTSQDKTIRITLPDSTWKVTQDADEMRVFSSGSEAMISIVHAADETAMKNITVARAEQDLNTSLSKQYTTANAFEVVEFEARSSSTLNTYEYVVKFNSTSMWAYSITYGILAENEAYVISGTVTDDNAVLLEAVKKSVESFTVLRNSVFSAVPGTVVNQLENSQSESTAQSESSANGTDELQSLTDYSTAAELYANDNVNIRLEPSTEADILGSLAPGDKVSVVGETSDWFKVNISGNIGYINKAFLVNTQPSADAAQTDETQPTVSESTMISAELNSYVDYGTSYDYYTTTDVNLRAQPGTDSDTVNTLDSGTAVSVIGETSNWYVVSVNGETGYVSKSYISSTNVSAENTSGIVTEPDDEEIGEIIDENSGNNTGTGIVSGTVTSASPTSIVVQGDDGNTYTIDTSDASVDTADGLYDGIYVSVTVDYAYTTPSGELYATSVSGE